MKHKLTYFVGQRLLFNPYDYTGLEPYIVSVMELGQNNAVLSNGISVGLSGDSTAHVGTEYCESGYVEDCVATLSTGQFFAEVERAVAAGVMSAAATMSNDELKTLVLSPYRELAQDRSGAPLLR